MTNDVVVIGIVAILLIIGIVIVAQRKPEGFVTMQTTNSLVKNGMITTFQPFSKQIGGLCDTNVTKLFGNSAKNIIFLHNTPFDSRFWLPLYFLAQKLKQEGRVIPNMYCYDIRGHSTAWIPTPAKYNDSNPDNHFWSYNDHAEDLKDVYDKQIKRGLVTIVGYGSGGNIAQAFGLKYPELVEALFVLQGSVGPRTIGLMDEIQYLSQWISQNPTVTFLTLEEQFVKRNLCLMFNCSDMDVSTNVQTSPEFLLAEKMYRTINSATNLQGDKLVASEDLRPLWAKSKITFPVSFLISNNDQYNNTAAMAENIQLTKKIIPTAKIYLVYGTHAFPLLNSQYVFDLVTGNDVSQNPLTIQVF